MYTRLLKVEANHSFFLFGPRGSGKTTWLKSNYPNAVYLDLLQSDLYRQLLANPELLETFVSTDSSTYVIIDEVQKIPELLNEVHRLIESPKHYKFILTGSSARKLRRQGTNLLAGRAYTYNMYPLTAEELKEDFDIEKAIKYGTLPSIYTGSDPEVYLSSYLGTYLEQEINQEAMTRSLSSFFRFLQTASYSQGSPINMSSIAREISINSKVVENYFKILEDLLIGSFLFPFLKRAKRRLVQKPKFYFFDAGIYNFARPKGYLDSENEIGGIALETLFLSHLKAINEYYNLNYNFTYFRTATGQEVDFIAYGEKGFHAFEIKHTKTISTKHLKGLRSFAKDYPEAKLHIFYLGKEKRHLKNITIHPFEKDIFNISKILTS